MASSKPAFLVPGEKTVKINAPYIIPLEPESLDAYIFDTLLPQVIYLASPSKINMAALWMRAAAVANPTGLPTPSRCL